ncbi:LysR substrate-binding domain-containing protein [Acinetobacter pullicarnis]|uniref:LysR substrate-binding domain-containing protein n=1 Tax=Acinetobacter pullicarnis TaxID=2576829 RepID=UPI0011215993|nr:LysR substrate-binding domain-containing protein [Acinetobacter pullicarnis]
MNELRRLDLNLLLSLDALLSDPHLTRAAERLNKSQPALSHDLAKLRIVFNDQLLLREGRGLCLSPKATQMKMAVKNILENIQQLILDQEFKPEASQRRFRLAMSDYGSSVILTKLLPIIRQYAPHIKIEVVQLSRRMMMEQVIEGQLDLAFGVFNQARPKYIQQKILFKERFISVMDRQFLGEAATLDLDTWLNYPHILVAVQTFAADEIDRVLAEIGRQRNIHLILPHWSVAAEVLLGTDLILTVAEKTIQTGRFPKQLTCFTPPLSIPQFDFSMIWHRNKDSDPALQWLLGVIQTLMQSESRMDDC